MFAWKAILLFLVIRVPCENISVAVSVNTWFLVKYNLYNTEKDTCLYIYVENIKICLVININW